MPAVPADLSIAMRWILPMTARDAVLENHTLMVRDGRILEVLPTVDARHRYAATVNLDRPDHVLLPGLVNARTRIAPCAGRAMGPQRLHDAALLCIAALLKSGTTCFCGLGYFPEESARSADAQGLRAVIGIPIAEVASPWATSPGEYLTRALTFRDEYRGHPSIATAFAPQSPCAISDATFQRIATLADELDAGIVISLHESPAAIESSMTRYGRRPIDRMQALGLLTPALAAANMIHVDAGDIALAQRSGIAITLCPEANLRAGFELPPIAAWAASGVRLSVGSGASATGLDLWSELKLLALLSRASAAADPALSAWDALCIATRGGAAALGLDAEIGTLETGKWADLCCVDLRSPALTGRGPVAPLAGSGARDMVSDVWVAGRHLVDCGAFTRLDWPALATRVSTWPNHPLTGEPT